MTQKTKIIICKYEGMFYKREVFNGSVGARVKLMVRGGCLQVRGSGRMTWKYQDDTCGCGQQ